ncbi:hypothetical protein [Burkholderia ubonensis]|uniref:hypothetical protein n=1 Tax=Burkholderia ubonensis TaxID=101571 RepID=UPI0012F7825C|nr:hypothetical protein [Burkholderia ubonensis]
MIKTVFLFICLSISLFGCIPTPVGLFTPATPIVEGYKAIDRAVINARNERKSANDRPVIEKDASEFKREELGYNDGTVVGKFKILLLLEKQQYTYNKKYRYNVELYYLLGDKISKLSRDIWYYYPVPTLLACDYASPASAVDSEAIWQFLEAFSLGNKNGMTYAIDVVKRRENQKPSENNVDIVDLYTHALMEGDRLAASRLSAMGVDFSPVLRAPSGSHEEGMNDAGGSCGLQEWARTEYDPESLDSRRRVFDFVKNLKLPSAPDAGSIARQGRAILSREASIFRSHGIEIDYY